MEDPVKGLLAKMPCAIGNGNAFAQSISYFAVAFDSKEFRILSTLFKQASQVGRTESLFSFLSCIPNEPCFRRKIFKIMVI